MKITKEYSDYNGATSYTIDLKGNENPKFKEILEGWLDALEFHELKSRDYSERGNEGENVWDLGLKGEWPGVTRKIQKLHKIIWKGRDVLFEGCQEILMDLMGAIGLMLMEQKRISDKYSASWRDNHNNKPTFGPGPRHDGFIEPGPEHVEKATNGPLSDITIFPNHRHVLGEDGRCTFCTLPKGSWQYQSHGTVIPRTTEPTGISVSMDCNCLVNHPGVPHMHG